MTSLIKTDNNTCDSKCHDAIHDKCECICGGRNHGKGITHALEETKQMFENKETISYQGFFKGGERAKVYDNSRFEYPNYFVGVTYCRVRIYKNGKKAFVLITEHLENEGLSVTNGIDRIATRISGMFPFRSNTVWIEHYLDRHPPGMKNDSMFDECFSIVTFATRRGSYFGPDWKHTTKEAVEEMIGLSIGD